MPLISDLDEAEVPLTVHAAAHTACAALLDVDGVVLALEWVDADNLPQREATVRVVADAERPAAVIGARWDGSRWLAPTQPPAGADPLVGLVQALRALTPAQTEQLTQLLAEPMGG